MSHRALITGLALVVLGASVPCNPTAAQRRPHAHGPFEWSDRADDAGGGGAQEGEPGVSHGAGARPRSRVHDSVLVVLQIGGLGGPEGLTVGGEWDRSLRGGRLLRLGATRASEGESDWAFARVGGILVRDRRLVLDVLADVGRGHHPEREFGYTSAELGTTWTLVAARLYGELAERYIDIDSLQGHLLRGGIAYLPSRTLGFRATVYHSVGGGDLESRLVLLRADKSLRRARVFAGASLGSEASGVRQPGAPGLRTDGVFTGFEAPVGGVLLGLTFTSDAVDGARQGHLFLSLRTRG